LRTALFVLLIGVLIQPVLLGFSQTRYDTEIADTRSQLEELKQQAESARRKARQFADQEKGVLGNLRQAEEALGATRKYIRKLDSRLATVQQDLRQTVVELSWAQDELTTRRGELARRPTQDHIARHIRRSPGRLRLRTLGAIPLDDSLNLFL